MAIFEANTLLWAPLLGVLSYAAVIAYRLCLHPLAAIPGPRLAAATSWYEFYYDVIGRGLFCWEIKRMHDRYGPIVRINPNEVHILDTSFYDEIYAPASKKRDKYAGFVVFLGVPTGSFATCPHEHHRIRRRALNTSFSKQAIYKIEGLIQAKVDRLCRRLDDSAARDHVLRLDAAFFALANDIIAEYTFGEGDDCLGRDDFGADFKGILMTSLETGALVRQFPCIVPLAYALPRRILAGLSGAFTALLSWEAVVRRRVVAMAEAHRRGEPDVGTCVFSALLRSDLPDEEKSFRRLLDEGKSLMGAGSETTSWTLTLLMWYVARDRRVLGRLRRELRDMPRGNRPGGRLRWLETRPYLNAVIMEALRLNHGNVGRSPRVAAETVYYKNHAIPPGTPMSSTNYWIHMDETIFPNPATFSPERWLDADMAGFPLQRYMVSFSRGSRQCVGQNLATAELCLAVAAVVTRFDVDFVDTTAEDILPARDCFVPRPVSHSRGVFARLLRVQE
ncbi:hypothetical protein E4U42_003537 [Claviceps africana]|uniref:Cytochrome P450 n=1 Tax=Claviceps africana TaxID=83212 RepID=A0A8K0J6F5_9HYPO|nr:hypothetical protein E4U42_003537 [Claviceps africana]